MFPRIKEKVVRIARGMVTRDAVWHNLLKEE